MRPENDPFFVQLSTVKLELKDDKDKQRHLLTETVSMSSKSSGSKVNQLNSNCHSPVPTTAPGQIPAKSETCMLNSEQELTSSTVSNDRRLAKIYSKSAKNQRGVPKGGDIFPAGGTTPTRDFRHRGQKYRSLKTSTNEEEIVNTKLKGSVRNSLKPVRKYVKTAKNISSPKFIKSMKDNLTPKNQRTLVQIWGPECDASSGLNISENLGDMSGGSAN